MKFANPIELFAILILIGPVLYYIYRAVKGEQIFVRRIPGVDAVDDAIGRSIELGRPMSFTSGLTGISPTLYACLGVLRYIARKAAIFSSRLIVPCNDPEALVLTDATLQNAYRSEHRFSEYDPATLQFLSEDQFAFASGYMGLIHRENVGSAFLFGRYAAESLILAEAGQQIGAIQIAATTSPEQIPFFITSCDYTLIGEELYAAGAFLSKDPVQTGSLRGQDYGKLLIFCLILLGIFQATLLSIQSGAIVETEQTPLAQSFTISWDDLGL